MKFAMGAATWAGAKNSRVIGPIAVATLSEWLAETDLASANARETPLWV
jgi:hypothetical protein